MYRRIGISVPGQLCVKAKVLDINGCGRAAKEDLQLLLIKHAEPFGFNEISEATKERPTLPVDLDVEAVVRHAMDVVDTVLIGDGNVAAVMDEFNCVGFAEFCK